MKTVHASLVTDATIRVRCACRQGFHLFGSNGDLSDRQEHRSSHCERYQGPLCIVIDEDTERVHTNKPKATKKPKNSKIKSTI
jgi:hypothetical protein